ncbi:hypothetical protein ACFL3P_00945 [Pseudomonadota bacterium]
MRKFYISLISLILTQSLHAETAAEIDKALSELDSIVSEQNDVISGWDSLLQQAGGKSFDKSDSNSDCVFPDVPEYAAPGWVCDEPIEGFDITAVGSGQNNVPLDKVEKASLKKGDYTNRVDTPIKAYISALIFGQQMINVTIDRMVREFNDEADVEQVENRVSKQITSLRSESGKVKLDNMLKHYAEYDDKGNMTDSISSSISKLIYNSSNCKSIIKLYVETTSDDVVDTFESRASRGQCEFNQIVEDMNDSGWKLLDMLKSPGGIYYALVGYDASLENQIKTSMENDKKLWEQFKAQEGIE